LKKKSEISLKIEEFKNKLKVEYEKGALAFINYIAGVEFRKNSGMNFDK
jgi:hypothetical protein